MEQRRLRSTTKNETVGIGEVLSSLELSSLEFIQNGILQWMSSPFCSSYHTSQSSTNISVMGLKPVEILTASSTHF